MGSLASYRYSGEQVSFSHRPQPPFDIDFVGCERQSDDADEEWLADLKDLVPKPMFRLRDPIIWWQNMLC